MTETPLINLSLVVPVYSGEAYLTKLTEAVETLRLSWQSAEAPVALCELILVDDAAIDGSADLIDRLASQHPWIVALHLSRNYGQHGATVAGILHSSGDWVVTLDEDMQHPPERIPELLAHATSQGFDVVYALPASADIHGTAWRDASSRGFKRLMEWLTGISTLRLVNSFRLIRGPIARATASVSSHNTYFDIALSWFTQRVGAAKMQLRDERFINQGKSGYNLRRLVSHAHKMLFSSQLRFLSLGIWTGILLFTVSFLAGLVFFVVRLVTPELIGIQGWTSLFLAICMSAGLLAVMVGLCLQYLSTLVLKAHGRPAFFTVDRSRDAALAAWFADTAPETLSET
ncbi:MAG: glycosyltransferase family 2 protein, partial [Pseudomonadota bacterium]